MLQPIYNTFFYNHDSLKIFIRTFFLFLGSPYNITWVRNSDRLIDLRFTKPKAYRQYKPEDLPENKLPPRIRAIEKMWCPYMSPVYRSKVQEK